MGQSFVDGPYCRLRTIGQAEFSQNCFDVNFHGGFGDIVRVGDLFVGFAIREVFENLRFAL